VTFVTFVRFVTFDLDMASHSEDGELSESDGELTPSDDENSKQTNIKPTANTINYTMFNTSKRNSQANKMTNSQDDDGVDYADMDPYSDYKPIKNGKEKTSMNQSPKSDNQHSPDEGQTNLTFQPIFGSKRPPSTNSSRREEKRRKRAPSGDDFLSELDQYNRIKDGGSINSSSRKKISNSYKG
jgi:hypothetical protein